MGLPTGCSSCHVSIIPPSETSEITEGHLWLSSSIHDGHHELRGLLWPSTRLGLIQILEGTRCSTWLES